MYNTMNSILFENNCVHNVYCMTEIQDTSNFKYASMIVRPHRLDKWDNSTFSENREL